MKRVRSDKRTVGAQDVPYTRRVRATPTQAAVVTAAARLVADKAEKKNIDVLSGNMITAATATGNLQLLNGVATGATAITRQGRRITMKSLYVIWEGSMAATSAGASALRLLIVYDKQANAAAPVATDVLASDAIYDMNNLSNSRRFVTLMDKTIDSVGTGGPQSWFLKEYKKLNLITEFNTGTAGTIADITSGSVYAFVWQNGNLITAAPTNALKVRIRFTDM